MSNTKFTKGPWFVEQMEDVNSVYDVHYNLPASEYSVASIVINIPDAEANAHLIAAAPDMYTMIGDLADMVDKLNEGFNTDHKAIELSTRAEMLLKKARGE